jgi:prepilin-type N-terminal cleavage/methylation domain-containing protein
MTRTAGRRRPGFTLVELMVAMALMMILTGSVVFIFIQAQKIFATVDARVQVYQYARYAFDQMERDLANVLRSSDMEFYNDKPPPDGRQGRYDPGEEIPISHAEDNDAIYNHSFTLREPDLYTGVDQEKHRHDSIYFKTVTSAGGDTSAALVEYALVDLDKERPKLVKRVWKVTSVDTSTPTRPKYQINGSVNPSPDQALPVKQDLCLYTIDARFELFVRNRRLDQAPDFYDCERLIAPLQYAPSNRQPFEPIRNDWAAPDRMIQTYYDSRHDQSRFQPDMGVFEPNERGLFHTQAYFSFPMLKEGDHLYLFGGGMVIPKEYTIDAFVKPDGSAWLPSDQPTDMRIKFKENPPDWPTGTPTTQPLLVDWDSSWLPPALRVTLWIKDAKSLQTRSVQRVFKILSSS